MTPQFVMPRIVPPFWRMRDPAVRAILGSVSGRKRHGWMGAVMGEDELFNLGEAAGADLGRC